MRNTPQREDGKLVIALAGGIEEDGFAVGEVDLESRRRLALRQGELALLGNERLGVFGGGAEVLLQRLP